MNKISIPVIGVLTLLLFPFIASAKSISGKLIFSINPGIGFYAMTDMNTLIEDTQSGFMGTSPSKRLDPLGMGLDLGTSLQYGLFDFLIIGVDLTYLVSDTTAKVSSGTLSPPQEQDEYYIISLPAMETGAFVKGAIPTQDILFTFGIGYSNLSLFGAGERLESRGTTTGLVYSSTTIPYSGNTTSIKIMGGFDYFMWDWLSLGLEGGYRLAKFENVTAKINGQNETLQNEDGSNLTLDYSGMFLHYTFRFYF
jgi:hypothetical protein